MMIGSASRGFADKTARDSPETGSSVGARPLYCGTLNPNLGSGRKDRRAGVLREPGIAGR